MAEIEETLDKLISLAKNKGYIASDCTIETLKDEVRQRRQDIDQKDDEEQMNAMKADLSDQTAAVRSCGFPVAVDVEARAIRYQRDVQRP